jgi:hypothetical protein
MVFRRAGERKTEEEEESPVVSGLRIGNVQPWKTG